MMKKDLLSFAESAAHGAALAGVGFVASYPSPSSAISEKLRNLGAYVFDTESQSSAIASAIGAELSGKRTFIALSNPQAQDFFTLSLMRLPVVAANTSMDGVFGLRDSGCIIFLAESCQEALDMTVQAFIISEKVMLPSAVNMGGTHNMREVVLIPNEKDIGNFLPALKIEKIDPKKIRAFTAADGSSFMVKCMQDALKFMDKMSGAWGKKFKRHCCGIESYRTEDADYILVSAGFDSPTIKHVVNMLRDAGEKIGLVRIRVLRPFPEDEVKKALQNAKKVAVIDSSVSGKCGILFSEMRHIRPGCINFIAIKELEEKSIESIFKKTKSETEGVIFL